MKHLSFGVVALVVVVLAILFSLRGGSPLAAFQNPSDTSPQAIAIYVVIGVLGLIGVASIPWMLKQGKVSEQRLAEYKGWQRSVLSRKGDPFGAYEPYTFPRKSALRATRASKTRKSRSRATEATPLKAKTKTE